MTIPPKGKGRLKREATELSIIEAFDRVARRDGLRNVRVNDVIKEAGIGKGLLYSYFGGLPGLIQAWGRHYRLWPSQEELVGTGAGNGPPPDPAEQIKQLVINHATCLKEHPIRIQLLAEELLNPTPISSALSDVRRQLGREHRAAFKRMAFLHDEDYRTLTIVMMAAASYLAMRAARGLPYMGEPLKTKADWNRLMGRFARIIELATRAAKDEKT